MSYFFQKIKKTCCSLLLKKKLAVQKEKKKLVPRKNPSTTPPPPHPGYQMVRPLDVTNLNYDILLRWWVLVYK